MRRGGLSRLALCSATIAAFLARSDSSATTSGGSDGGSPRQFPGMMSHETARSPTLHPASIDWMLYGGL
jgi:hypothetical protein